MASGPSAEGCLVMIMLAYLCKNTRKLAGKVSLRDHSILKGNNIDTIILFMSLIFLLKWTHLGYRLTMQIPGFYPRPEEGPGKLCLYEVIQVSL